MSGLVDDATLRRSLEKAVGPEDVRTDEASRRTYSTDASPCAVEPRAVAFVDSEADIRAVLDVCRAVDAHDVPVDGAEWRELVGRVGGLERIWREIADHREAIVASRRPIRKNSCGYDVLGLAESLDRGIFPLASLFVGSEGTLGIVT